MCCWCVACISSAQQQDEARVAIRAIVADNKIPAEAAANLETKMQRALAANGFSDNSCTERFVLTAKANITQKDIAPTTPARVSQKMDITFIVGDVVENKIYETYTISVAGIGTTETKAFISAFGKIKPENKELHDMLTNAKNKIVDYYANSCGEIIKKAETAAAIGNYDEAIAMLIDVPSVCSDCFDKCQAAAIKIYGMKMDAEGMTLLQKARAVWMANADADGAAEVAAIICNISPRSAAFSKAEKLRKEITEKLAADERLRLEQSLKRYNDSMALKRSMIKACRDIGVAWGQHQPTSIVRNIIARW